MNAKEKALFLAKIKGEHMGLTFVQRSLKEALDYCAEMGILTDRVKIDPVVDNSLMNVVSCRVSSSLFGQTLDRLIEVCPPDNIAIDFDMDYRGTVIKNYPGVTLQVHLFAHMDDDDKQTLFDLGHVKTDAHVSYSVSCEL